MSAVWRQTATGLVGRTDRERVLDAVAAGGDVPADIAEAATAADTWGRYTRADYSATRWAGSGATWSERMDRRVPDWRQDPPGWFPDCASALAQRHE